MYCAGGRLQLWFVLCCAAFHLCRVHLYKSRRAWIQKDYQQGLSWARIFKLFRSPIIDSNGTDSAKLRSLAGRYDNPIPSRFLAPINCLKIPALSWELAPPTPPPPWHKTHSNVYLSPFFLFFTLSSDCVSGKGVAWISQLEGWGWSQTQRRQNSLVFFFFYTHIAVQKSAPIMLH